MLKTQLTQITLELNRTNCKSFIVYLCNQPKPIHIMKKIFAADKHSYGSDFMREFDTLDKLKRGIVENELWFEMYDFEKSESNYNDTMYTEELFKEHSKGYTLYEIDLHEEEELQWSEYDGQSSFRIVKIEPKILSSIKQVDI